eukprot:746241-Hanusia_phi.AAC.1
MLVAWQWTAGPESDNPMIRQTVRRVASPSVVPGTVAHCTVPGRAARRRRRGPRPGKPGDPLTVTVSQGPFLLSPNYLPLI